MTAAAPVYLWQADSATQGDRGVSDQPAKAREAAGRCLLGGAPSALVEQATPALGVSGLDGAWCRTGEAWRAAAAPGGGFAWVRVEAA